MTGVRHINETGFAAEEIPDVEIRLAAVLMTSVYMVVATIGVKKVNQVKLRDIQKQTESANALTDSVLSASGNMISNISDMTEKVAQLGESMDRIHTYMSATLSDWPVPRFVLPPPQSLFPLLLPALPLCSRLRPAYRYCWRYW